jgi:hypothetical protein
MRAEMPQIARRPKPIVNRVREFICKDIGQPPLYHLGLGIFAPRLPDDYALRVEAWAKEAHRGAARAILDAPEIFPRGSIGFTWARKVLDPGLSVVKREKA